MISVPQHIHELGEIRIAVECCVRFQDKVLLQKRPDDSKSFPGFLTFPGGHIDVGEDHLQAIIREVKEETSITISEKDTKLRICAINHHIDRAQVWMIFGFVADLDGFVEPNSSDEGECTWHNIDEVKNSDKIFPPIKYYFEHIFNNKPGVLYMAGKWEKSQLVEMQSESTDSNS